METQKQEQLNVYMLGGFSVQYLGKEILLGRKKHPEVYSADAANMAERK